MYRAKEMLDEFEKEKRMEMKQEKEKQDAQKKDNA